MDTTDPTPSDLDLIRAFARGSRAALGQLAERYERSLLGLARGMLGGRRELAADAVQDMWVRVIRHAARFDGRASVKTWLYRILINRCHDLCAAARRHAPLGLGQHEQGQEASSQACAGEQPDEEHGALSTVVSALPDNQQTVLLLCYHAGMSHAQAADILGIPPGTLKSRLHAALEALRTALAPNQGGTR